MNHALPTTEGGPAPVEAATQTALPRRVLITVTIGPEGPTGLDPSDLSDLIMAELANEGFEGMVTPADTPDQSDISTGLFSIEEAGDQDIETGHALVARLKEQYGIKAHLEVETYDPSRPGAYTASTLSPYPILGGRVWILPPGHPRPAEAAADAHTLYMLESMAFGTGHHPTTQLMSGYVLDTCPIGGRVIDAGTGTALLALLALHCGAAGAEAFDHDATALAIAAEICQLNGIEPGAAGSMEPLTLERGDLGDWHPKSGPADLVLANITRNLNRAHLPDYAQWLNTGGQVITSGYFEEDQPLLTESAAAAGLVLIDTRTKTDAKGMTWCAARYQKA